MNEIVVRAVPAPRRKNGKTFGLLIFRSHVRDVQQ